MLFLCLKPLLGALISFCINFLWVGTKSKVAWKDIYKPKTKGGLGLKTCKIWINAMIMKILWNISESKESLWIKWVHTFYLKKRDIWEWTCGLDNPPLFKNMEKIRNILLVRTVSKTAAMNLLKSWSNGIQFSIAKAYDWLRCKDDCKP